MQQMGVRDESFVKQNLPQAGTYVVRHTCTGAREVWPAVRAATSSLAAQLQALASGGGGGVSVLEAACGVLLVGRETPDPVVGHLQTSPAVL